MFYTPAINRCMTTQIAHIKGNIESGNPTRIGFNEFVGSFQKDFWDCLSARRHALALPLNRHATKRYATRLKNPF